MLFIPNKYYKWYSQIIDNARSRPPLSTNFENHHVVPKSLGGLDEKSNLVRLSYREHFICHLLLPKFVSVGRTKMVNALWRMLHPKANKYKITSHTYSTAKIDFINSKRGVARSKKTRENISKSRKGKCVGTDNPFYGKTHSQDTIKKMSDAKKGKKTGPCTQERKDSISSAKKGKSLSETHRHALSQAKQGRTWSDARKQSGRKIMTPNGVFNSMAEAERALGLGSGCVAYRVKTQPEKFYFITNPVTLIR